MKVLKVANGLFPRFFYHLYFAIKLPNRGYSRHFGFLKRCLFPLPPLNEQRRIVERVEVLFDEIDKGIESLQAAKKSLGLYGQSLLKSAFEGRLTADWRTQNADKLEDPKTLLARLEKDRDAWHECEFQRWQDAVATWKSDGSKGPKPRKPETYKPSGALTEAERAVLPKMPSCWVYVRLNDIAHIGSGMSVSKARKLEDPVETPYLRVANVQRGHLDLAEIKTMPVEKSQLSALSLRTWDILFNEGGDRDKLGRGWIWEDQIEICITQNHVFRATPFRHDKGWSVFVSQWGNSYGRDYFEAGGKQTTNLASINKTVLKALPVPICSPAEQAEITRLLDVRLEAADALDAEIDAALTRADALRQSILKKAFSGQLVSQDPEDEPASALLERIKTEKAERDQAAKRGRKSAPTRKSEVRRPTLTDLIEVLEKQKDWISAAKAAQELGIGDGSTSDDVEAFYRQLKNFVEDGVIEVERRDDEDWLRLATAEVS
ncbi:type I restriction enzyme, S subunit [Halomonas daqiaonensis]|uniref:Type I restriction enzyme, S subunit n=1 Tax=Halomonas daqiaonensis TaxID=650850 RepID=A0A1H7P183_9GAMM|nr:type I restriction enzyme, S subunit [Halomonas daqiaonensis]